jgi:hypothetical protein
MDIDIRKPGEAKQAKGFETLEELLERLLIDIEPHYSQKLHINYSGGGGVHAFVPFAEPVDYKTFYSAARQLVAHTKNILGFDSSCTMNPVGILRVPGSINSKKKKAVEVLQWGEALHRPKYVNGTSLEGEKKEQDYLDRRYASVTLADLVDTCGHIAKLAAGWNDQPYESWLGCATVLKRVEGGVEAFHEWSKQSVQWQDEETTQAKIDSTDAPEPQSCKTFQVGEMGRNPCSTCPNKAKSSNPLKLSLQSRVTESLEIQPSEIPLP